LAASLIFSSFRSVDSLFLGYFGSAADVGQYGAVIMVAQLIGLLGLALGQTLGARIALCHRNSDIAGMERLLAENIRLTSLFSAPVFAAIVFWGDRIDLVLGPTFAVDASVVSIVAARMLVQTMFGCSGFVLSMTGRHLRETGLLGIGLLASVVLCFALIPGYGQIGAALAGFISLSMVNVSRYAVVRSVFGIKHVKLGVVHPLRSRDLRDQFRRVGMVRAGYTSRPRDDCQTVYATSFDCGGRMSFPKQTPVCAREIISSVLAPIRRIEGI
jgi:O-antigen/teichoic acid export membrane protein